MTVLYLTNNPRLAGTARILMSWLELGRARGIDGCVVVQERGELSSWLEAQKVPYVVSAMPWISRRAPVKALREAWRVSRWARRHGVSIVHCNEHDVYPFGVLVARLLRAPAVCHIRFAVDRGFCSWAFGGWRRPDALLWTTSQQRQDCAAAIDGIVDESRQHLIRLGPDRRFFEAGNGDRDQLRERFDIGTHELAIGTATALRPVKRIEDFVAMAATLATRHPNVVSLIAGGAIEGEERYRAGIQEQIAATGLGRRLRWIGHHEPIESFLRALDVFVSTSEYETFGNSVCEAMACGLPVVACVGGSVHEIVGDAGAVVANRDVNALTMEVESLLTDDGRRAGVGNAGRQRVAREFSPARSFEQVWAIYRRLGRS